MPYLIRMSMKITAAITKIKDNQEQVFTINTIYVIYAHQYQYHKPDL